MEINSKRTLGVIVDALYKNDVKIIDKYVQPTRYGEYIEIVVAPTKGIYNIRQLEEFRTNLVPGLPTQGISFRTGSSHTYGSLGYRVEGVPTVEIGSYKLKKPRGRRDICVRIYATEQMARNYKEERQKNINRTIMKRTVFYMIRSYFKERLEHFLHH